MSRTSPDETLLLRQWRWICPACGWTSRLLVIPHDLETINCPACGAEIDVKFSDVQCFGADDPGRGGRS